MKRGVLGVLVALLSALVLYWLAATGPGLRWLMGEIEARVPGVTVARAEGALLGDIVLSGLAYREGATKVGLDRLEIRWEPAALRHGVWHGRSIRAEGLRVAVAGKSASEEPPAWPTYRWPLAVVVDDFQLREGQLQLQAGATPVRIDRLDTAFSLNGQELRITRLEVALPKATANVSGRVELSGERTVDLHTDWTLRLADRPELQGAGTLTGQPRRLLIRQTLRAPVAAELSAELMNPLAAPTWTARLEMPRFAPNRIDPAWKSWPVTLNLTGQGTADEAAMDGSITAVIPEVGEARAHARGRYRAPGDIAIDTLALALPGAGAEIVVDGTLRSLRDMPVFNLAARWRNLAWPLAPSMAKDTENQWRSREGRLTVTGNARDIRFDLNGKLRDRQVEAGGNLGVEAERTLFRGVRVRGAGAEVALDGVFGERVDFTWTLSADDLGLWLPGARGRMNSRGTVQGPRNAPAVEAELAARAVRFQDNGADALNLKLRAGLQPDSPLDFDLSAEALRVAGQVLAVTLTGQGTRARHRLTGLIEKMAGGEAGLQWLAEGGLQGEAWAGNLARFEVAAPALGRWVLRRPAALRLGRTGGELGLACWDGGDADACLQGRLSSTGEWRMTAELSRLPMTRFREALPETVAVSGVLGGTADFTGQGGRVGEGRLELSAAEARLEWHAGDRDSVRFVPNPLSLHARVSGRATELSLTAEQPDFASLRGEARLDGPLDLARLQQLPLAGDVAVDLRNLAVLDPWTQDIEGLQGTLNASLRLGGTVGTPALALQASVPEAGFSVPRLGVRVRKATLNAHTLDTGTLVLDGRALSGDGNIHLNGTQNLDAAAGWPLNLTLRGRRFLAADLPEAKVYVSPDLAIAFAEGKLALQGTLTVPEAVLRIPEQAGAVKPSEDVVKVGAEVPPDRNGVPVATQVAVVLGDNIRVQGAGFEGRVDGRVLVEQAPRGPVLGTGQINIRDGKYAFYGMELAIDEGRLLFAHSPVDNPSLDINVTRRTESTLAGLKVLGTLKQPNVTLYADTPMAQADILAYLVTGKPLGLASRQEGSALRQAAVSLGGPAGNLLAREISDRLGLGGLLDDISVQDSLAGQGAFAGRRGTEAYGAQNTALFLGKYLTPQLYVQYGVGLLQSGNVFRLRYELGKHWKLQTETGDYSGGDILYQWEK